MLEEIRLVSIEDSSDILKIYKPFVLHTPISFEIETPTIQEFSKRIINISKQYPYLVYTIDKKIIAYAYASKHKDRAAYCYDVDVSVYVLPEHQGKEIAQKLYQCLFSLLKELRYYNAFAGCTEPNEKSIKLHQKFGFKTIGTFRNVGYKLGKWHDVTYLQKNILDYQDNPEVPKSIQELSSKCIQDILNPL